MLLDEVEGHLHRGHTELIGTHEEHGHPTPLEELSHSFPSVVVGIVEHDQSVLPPSLILRVQMGTELGEEEPEGVAGGLADVRGVEEVAVAAEGSNQVDTVKARGGGHLVPDIPRHPTPLSLVSVPDHRLVHVDDVDSARQASNVKRGCQLPLELGCNRVLDLPDWLNFAEGGMLDLSQVTAQPGPAHSESTLRQQLSLEVSQLQRDLGLGEQPLDHTPGSLMDLGEPLPSQDSC